MASIGGCTFNRRGPFQGQLNSLKKTSNSFERTKEGDRGRTNTPIPVEAGSHKADRTLPGTKTVFQAGNI